MAKKRQVKQALTKAELARAVYEKVRLTQAEAGALVDVVFEVMKDAVADPDDGEVKVTRFGTFMVRQKGARPARNPRTMEEVMLRERRVLNFRMSQVLKAAVNKESKS